MPATQESNPTIASAVIETNSTTSLTTSVANASIDAAPASAFVANPTNSVAAVVDQPIDANTMSSTQTVRTALRTAAATPAVQLTAAYQLNGLIQTAGMLLPVRAAIEDWPTARRLAVDDSNWKAWLAGRRDLVTKWFAAPRDRLDLIAGYPNDLVDPTTGVAVNWTIDMPEPPAGSTAGAVKFKQAWVAINRQYNITRTLDAARFYQLTGDIAMAETAAKQLDFYAQNYMSWPLRTAIGNARMLGQSLDEAGSVLEMLEAAKALQSYASQARAATWRLGLFKPMAANLQTYAYGALNNIDLWCAAAVAAIGLQTSDQTLIDAGTTGPRGISAVIAQGVTLDGIWSEGSFAYNNYVVLALARFFDLAALTGRSDLVTRYAPAVQRMLLAPVLFRFDDGTLPRPSDTRGAVPPIDTGTHAAMYRHVPTTFGVQSAAANRSWPTLIDPPQAGVQPGALPASQSIHAEDTRMLLMRKGDWQLFVHYGQKTINHAQEEALSYELVKGSNSITRDAGTATSYSSIQHLEYFSKGVGNNVPLIDGLGQEQWAPGTVQAIDAAAGNADLLQPTYRKDVSARRSFALATDSMTETTRITLLPALPTARRLGVMFNTTCAVTVLDTRAGTATPGAAPLGSPGFSQWTNVTTQLAQATWTAHLDCAGKLYELTMTGPGPHTVYRATAPNTPLPATRSALYVETSGTDVSFTTRIRALP